MNIATTRVITNKDLIYLNSRLMLVQDANHLQIILFCNLFQIRFQTADRIFSNFGLTLLLIWTVIMRWLYTHFYFIIVKKRHLSLAVLFIDTNIWALQKISYILWLFNLWFFFLYNAPLLLVTIFVDHLINSLIVFVEDLSCKRFLHEFIMDWHVERVCKFRSNNHSIVRVWDTTRFRFFIRWSIWLRTVI